ncbi:ligand-binding sensor domain-containing protein [Rosettibacter firmus]|uniref:ligand-binding sensor domain-containing protein n=1 Tax=Rosettibacter firmus TaxID=3111522 RepID=UPI00336BD2EB
MLSEILYSQVLDTSKLFTQYVVDQWTTKEGLPQNSAYSIIQTKDGFIWFGTEEGFVKFDGIRFTIYNPDNIEEMKNSLVVNIIEDSKGNLWVGTFDGLLKYSEKEIKLYTSKDGLMNSMIRSLYEDEYGRIWVGTSTGLNYFENNKIKKFNEASFLDNQIIYRIIGNKNGKIYLATQNSGVVIIDYSKKNNFVITVVDKNKGLSSNYVRALHLSNNGLLVGTDKGLDLIVNAQVKNYNLKNALYGLQIMDIIEDESKILYLATQKGICRIVNNKIDFYTFQNNLENNLILDLFIDKEENLWVGSYNNGLYRIRDGNFTTYSLEEGLKERFIRAITQNSKGIWVASSSGYISLINNKEIKNFFLNRNDNSIVQTMYALGDSIWIGTRTGLYLFYNNRTKKYCDFSIASIFRDSKNRLLIGSGDRGLFELKAGKLISLSKDDKSSRLGIRFITENINNTYYFGTVGQGLIKYDGNNYTYYTEEDGLPSNLIYSVYSDLKGNLWMTASGGGIVHYDGKKFTKITKRNGLPTNEIQTITEDNLGNFWCGYNNGIFKVSKSNLEKFVKGKVDTIHVEIFNTNDGMKNSECNGGYMWTTFKDNTGKIWFATIDGVTFVNPAKLKYSSFIPPVHVTRVLADFQPVELKPIIKTTAGINILRFDYIAPSFIEPRKLKYRYILEGFENKWHEFSNRRFVIYYNLEPGEYKFRVKVSNYYNQWNNKEATVKVIIPPYFYQTTIFKIFAPLFFIGLVFVIIKWKLSKQEALNEKLENLVRKRTEELNDEIIKREKAQNELKEYAAELEKVNSTKDKFISILSHDLRNPINSISSISEFLHNNRKELTDEELDDMLLQIRNSSLTLYNLIENLLEWSRIQTKKLEYVFHNFDITESIKNSISVVDIFAKQKGINITCNCKDGIIVLADKTSIESVLMNLLSNAIKFSYPKGDILVKVKENENYAEVTIQDFGIGIDQEDINKIFSLDSKFTKLGTTGEKGTGLGLILCKEHIIKNGGKLWIESQLNKGTTVYFTIPLAK